MKWILSNNPMNIVFNKIESTQHQECYEADGFGLMLYQCPDKTWRVLFERGNETSIADDKIRNIHDIEQAFLIARGWYLLWIEENQHA